MPGGARGSSGARGQQRDVVDGAEQVLRGASSRAGGVSGLGEERYLWALVALEVLAIGWLRAAFKRAHGG